jgi:uncharacterized protein (TIGR02001 family)
MFSLSRLPLAVLASAVFAAPAFAQTGDANSQPAEPTPALTATGSLTLASQYRFRGISLSDEEIALQGTVNLNHKSGFYAGVWGSTLDGFGELGGSNLELDLYVGYKRQVVPGVTVDAGLLYYAYPGSSGGDFEFWKRGSTGSPEALRIDAVSGHLVVERFSGDPEKLQRLDDRAAGGGQAFADDRRFEAADALRQ